MNDGTTITYSDIKLDDTGKEYVVIYFETPCEDGFKSMQISYPNGTPENVIGYSSEEINVLMYHYKKSGPIVFDFAKEGD